jgi:hypothetical protein
MLKNAHPQLKLKPPLLTLNTKTEPEKEKVESDLYGSSRYDIDWLNDFSLGNFLPQGI